MNRGSALVSTAAASTAVSRTQKQSSFVCSLLRLSVCLSKAEIWTSRSEFDNN